MRIGLDVMVLQKPGSVATYTRTLLEGLLAAGQDHTFFLYGPSASFETIAALPGVHFREVTLQLLHTVITQDQLDVFHGPDGSVPVARFCPTISTIHDTLILKNLDGLPEELWRTRTREILFCAELATRIIAPSQHTAGCIAQDYGIAVEKIEVIYKGLPSHFRQIEPERARAAVEPLGIASPYLLYTGAIHPRKNLKTLLTAFEEVRKQYAPPLKLVITRGLCNGEIVAELAELLRLFPDLFPQRRSQHLAFSDNLVLTGPLDTDMLVSLYNLAGAVVYPPLIAGSALPPLEAMACGAPVVASNASCLPEMLGDAAQLVDPSDCQGFIAAMLKLLNDNNFADEKRAKGLKHVEKFSSQIMAQKTLQLYEKTLCQTIINIPSRSSEKTEAMTIQEGGC